jgi:hypothetical protein
MKQLQSGMLMSSMLQLARKVLCYIVEKLDLKIPSGMQRPGLDKAVNYLEQLCHEQLVPPEIDESHVSTKVLPNRRQAGGWLESEVWVEKTKGFIQTRVKDSIKPSASVF